MIKTVVQSVLVVAATHSNDKVVNTLSLSCSTNIATNPSSQIFFRIKPSLHLSQFSLSSFTEAVNNPDNPSQYDFSFLFSPSPASFSFRPSSRFLCPAKVIHCQSLIYLTHPHPRDYWHNLHYPILLTAA